MKPKIVCICGSNRFKDDIVRLNDSLTKAGEIVVATGAYATHLERTDPELKARLDELHLRKIDLADYVMVVNRDGYIGQSTKREIEYAVLNGKVIRFTDEARGATYMEGFAARPAEPIETPKKAGSHFKVPRDSHSLIAKLHAELRDTIDVAASSLVLIDDAVSLFSASNVSDPNKAGLREEWRGRAARVSLSKLPARLAAEFSRQWLTARIESVTSLLKSAMTSSTEDAQFKLNAARAQIEHIQVMAARDWAPEVTPPERASDDSD